jgi:hypothetical protein
MSQENSEITTSLEFDPSLELSSSLSQNNDYTSSCDFCGIEIHYTQQYCDGVSCHKLNDAISVLHRIKNFESNKNEKQNVHKETSENKIKKQRKIKKK